MILSLQVAVEKLSRMEHPNLVLFLGFCIEKNSKFLCYELMPNGNLEDRLHGTDPGFSNALDHFKAESDLVLKLLKLMVYKSANRERQFSCINTVCLLQQSTATIPMARKFLECLAFRSSL